MAPLPRPVRFRLHERHVGARNGGAGLIADVDDERSVEDLRVHRAGGQGRHDDAGGREEGGQCAPCGGWSLLAPLAVQD